MVGVIAIILISLVIAVLLFIEVIGLIKSIKQYRSKKRDNKIVEKDMDNKN